MGLTPDSGTGTQDGGITGTYALVMVNGSPMPAVVQEEPGYTEEVLEGSLTLLSDNTYLARFVFRETEGGATITEEDIEGGTYLVSGSQITFMDAEDPDDDVQGVISGNTITVTVEEDRGLEVWVFEK